MKPEAAGWVVPCMAKESFWDRPLGQIVMAVGLVAWVVVLLFVLWYLVFLVHIVFNLPLDIE
jgi:hypothetical protein